MVPKLHAKGRSFKGVSAYLLHDKGRARTSERVAWAETRNLASDDPEIAWRVMAATSMDQERLKAQAGVKNTGRKSGDHVLHFTLSWHPDEKDTLSRDEMRRAAIGALAALRADERQALLIAHTDEPHPHLHVVVNRVSPEDGRVLSSSKEKLSLSRWAEAYEKERGQIFCEERVLNNEARARGEFIRAAKDKARHILETEEPVRAEVANDNASLADRLSEEQKRLDAALAQRGRDQAERHRQEWAGFERDHRERQAETRRQADLAAARALDAIRQKYRPARRELLRNHQAEQAGFEERERSLRGKIENVKAALDHARQVRGEDARRSGIGDLFRFLAFAGERRDALRAAQEARQKALEREQQAREAEAAARIQSERQALLAASRQEFAERRAALVEAQRLRDEALRADWAERSRQREEAWANLSRKAEMAQAMRDSFEEAAAPEREAARSSDTRSAGLRRDFSKAAEPEAPKQDQQERGGRDYEAEHRAAMEEFRSTADESGEAHELGRDDGEEQSL